MISDTLNITIAAKATSNGIMDMLREQSRDLFHLSDADRISFADNNKMSAITASTPYSGRPIGVVIETIPAAAEDIVLVVVVVIVLVSIINTYVMNTNIILLKPYEFISNY